MVTIFGSGEIPAIKIVPVQNYEKKSLEQFIIRIIDITFIIKQVNSINDNVMVGKLN